MAQQKVDIKMARFDNAPWGFRVHGGIDFGSPLTIQKVRQYFVIIGVSKIFLLVWDFIFGC